MSEPRLIIKKHPRGEYEIGTFTDDGAIVARVSVRDERMPDTRTDHEKETDALERARRLVRALQDTLDKTRDRDDDDYRQVKKRISDLTEDLPELREILQNLVDEGIQAHRA